MPLLEPKKIQKEIECDLFWPVYWFYGEEKMKEYIKNQGGDPSQLKLINF